MNIKGFFNAIFKQNKSNEYWTVLNPILPYKRTADYISMYKEVGWLFAVVSKIAEGISQAGWTLFQQKDGKWVEVSDENNAVIKLLDKPNPYCDSFDLFFLTSCYMDLVGEAFWYLNFVGKRPAEIWVLYPQFMRVNPGKTKMVESYEYLTNNGKVVFSPEEIIHFKRHDPANHLRGVSPLSAGIDDIDSERYSARWNKNFFQNSAVPPAIIEAPGKVTDDTVRRLREQWKGEYGGADNAHRIAVLSGGAKFNLVALTRRDMEFIEGRKLTRENILGLYGVPLAILGVTEGFNRANMETAEYVFAKYVLKPRLTLLEVKISEFLLPYFDKNLYFQFNFTAPRDRSIDLEIAERGFSSGIITRNEARELLGFGETKDGNVYSTSLNVLYEKQEKAIKDIKQKALHIYPVDDMPAIWEGWKESWDKTEAKWIRELKKFFQTQQDDVIEKLKTKKGITKIMPDEVLFERAFYDELITSIAKPLLIEAFREGILASGELAPAFNISDPLAIQWIRERAGTKIKNINITTLQKLRETLADGVMQGESIPKLIDRVGEVFKEAKGRRAEAIARTETLEAFRNGQILTWKKVGYKMVEWWTAEDERVCPECMPRHGEKYSIDGIPERHVNCRCALIAIVEE